MDSRGVVIVRKLSFKPVFDIGCEKWPTISTDFEIEHFLSTLTQRFNLEPITVLVRSKKWIREWAECPKAVACAWREDEKSFAAFSEEIFVPLYPKWRFFRSWKERFFFLAVLHEFVHVYMRLKHPDILESHSPEFFAMEESLAREFGLRYLFV